MSSSHMMLSKNFSLAELTLSRTAAKRGWPNSPNLTEVVALTALAVNVLQRVRDHFGKPVIVTSGFRGRRLNSAIRGSNTSQHCYGEAADFTVAGVSNLEVAKWIEANLQFDQLIYEFGEGGWLHCSYRKGRLRRETLSARRVGGRTRYFSGLGT